MHFDKQHKNLYPEENLKKETSIFDHIASEIFIFIMALVSLIVTIIVIMLLFKGAKMWALITNLVMQKSVKALTEGKEECSNYEYWIIIMWITLILLGIIILIIEKAPKMPILENINIQYRNKVWDILEIDWKNVLLMVNGNVVNLPGLLIIPF